MSKIRSAYVAWVLASLAAPATLSAQAAALSFPVRVTQPSSSATVPNGGTVSMVAEGANKPLSATVTVTYRGTGIGSITRVELVGALEFELGGLPQLPSQLTPGQPFTFQVRFTPTSTKGVNAQLFITVGDQPSSSVPPVTALITINFVGAVPEMSVVYILPTNLNPITVNDGGSILVPPTVVNTATTVAVVVLNRGSGPLDLRSITLKQSGQEFEALGLPLLPGFVDPGRDARFTLRYSPRQEGTHSAVLQVVATGQTVTASVQGTSTSPLFSYEILDSDTAKPLVPGTPFILPDTDLGATLRLAVRVRNTGSSDGQIAGITAVGAGFQVTDLPFLPLILAPGSSVFFTLTFTPTQAGRVVGRMRIGNETFELVATGLGPRLSFSVGSGATEALIAPNGAVNFPTIPIGQRTSFNFTISNSGTTPAVFTSIGTPSNGEFTLVGLPPFPRTLAAGEKLTFEVYFQPSALGPNTSTLHIDSLVFTLSGFGGAPPSLPTYRFDGATSPQPPLQQPSIGLLLDSPYPATISGNLTISFNSNSYAVDPALQFITGGMSAGFTIPANTTRAIFANNTTQIRLQTGTVSGTIVITPSFSLAGSINLTPTRPAELRLDVSAQAPGILSLGLGPATGPNSLELLVTGYSNTRTLSRMNLAFGPRQGAQFGATQFAIDLSTQATLWYRNTASQNFGSLFTISMPFVVQGLSGQQLSDVLEGVAVTLTNDQGTSSPATLRMPSP